MTSANTIYAEAKQDALRSSLAKICKDDPPDIVERVGQFAKEEGIVDPLTIARIGWMLMGEREMCAKRALNAYKRGCNAKEIASAVRMTG